MDLRRRSRPPPEASGAPLVCPAPVCASAHNRVGRLRQLNRKVKQIDGETRSEVRNARLESLENDKWTQEVRSPRAAAPRAKGG